MRLSRRRVLQQSSSSDSDGEPIVNALRAAAATKEEAEEAAVAMGSVAPTVVPAVATKEELAGTPRPAKAEVKVEAPATPRSTARGRRKVVWTESHFEPINTWWEKPLKRKGDPHWRYLEHSGLMFHPAFVAHGIPMRYNGWSVPLPPLAEEVVTFWCAALNSDYVNKSVFVQNFWSAFLKSLPPDHVLFSPRLVEPPAVPDSLAPSTAGDTRVCGDTGVTSPPESSGEEDVPLLKRRRLETVVPQFELAEFGAIAEYLTARREREKEERRQRTKEARLAEREAKLVAEGRYMYCLHDGIREKVASYKAEVPGLFRGRGEHPKMGLLKRRVLPDEVCLNLSETAPVPRVPEWLRGHAWKDVFHDPHVTWLAFYRDTMIGTSFKYVFMGASSAVKGSKDYMKYELARQLKTRITAIRRDYTRKMLSKDAIERQLGVAAYVIDALALRVGNEKDREEEADTVGCCSLRVEHVTNLDDAACQVTLDFLGKDSIRYLNTVKLDPLAYKTFKELTKRKKKQDNIFNLIHPGSLNRYLKELMPGLSAKVFRTYNASFTLQRELLAADPLAQGEPAPGPPKDRDGSGNGDPGNGDDSGNENGDDSGNANGDDSGNANGDDSGNRSRQRAENIFGNINTAKRFYEDANRTVAILCNHQRSVSKTHDTSMAKLVKQFKALQLDILELQAFIKATHENQDTTVWDWVPTPIPNLLVDLDLDLNEDEPPDEAEGPRQSVIKPNTKLDTAVNKLAVLKARSVTQELRIKMKDENKTVANNTSKQHYMDPRITVAFCKRYDLPIEKFFNATLMKKFPWAMFAKGDFVW
ncbi:putative DNA topoisomerase I [Gregarina niphandrodes]|uniref:DNA topoisomerase 1 n=1 Tax=Gregarina niphandrodes TaxID=110365 RepID=A0A023AWJ6_GRENI|nr:putative DNA topoisomerase I [Gregarina niphandrodes]EZG43121.1 putative DNA topoisomerase I [Gregarina niphandrodes]|eukprot:XP_011133621.1 putative DNA topoisomerase I [Gregarina niphandrodes]